MLQLNMLTSDQQTYLEALAAEYALLLPEAVAVHSLILIFDVLEALEFTAEQIEAVFGSDIMLYLTGLLYGAKQASNGKALAVAGRPIAAVPLLTINGKPVPFLGTVDGEGRIRYTLDAAPLLKNGSDNGVVHLTNNGAEKNGA
jgi:hypothetical protein